jgi:guanylate kinase
MEKGKVVLILGVSGAGKSTLQTGLQNSFGWKPIVSFTTRPPRAGEVDGVHYHFVTREQFDTLRPDLVEAATVHGNEYGLLGADLWEPVNAGEIRTLVIDHQGAKIVREYLGRSATPTVLLWVDRHEQYARLLARGTDSPEVIQFRCAVYESEMAACVQLSSALYASSNLSDLMDRVVKHVTTYNPPEAL